MKRSCFSEQKMIGILKEHRAGPGKRNCTASTVSTMGSVALFESFRCSALDLRLCGFIEQVCNVFNFVENAGFVI